MNFNFLATCTEMEKLKCYCFEAEEFALSYPDISITASRKAAEYIVKMLYGSVINSQINGMTVFDMLRDTEFIRWLHDDTLLQHFHFIRRVGNQAVHQGGKTSDEALHVLESLHTVVGEICLRLGLIAHYAPFNPQLECEAPEDEPVVDQAMIARMAGRLHNVFAPSQQRKEAKIIDGFISTKDMAELKKLDPSARLENTAANSRAAFQMIAEYLANMLGEDNVLADYQELLLHIRSNSRKSVVAVRTASCRLAVKSAQGDWLYLPGIDYVIYTDKLNAQMPVLEQFRVFTVQEFCKLWESIKLVRTAVSSGTAKRLKQVLGAETKITIEEYGDELRVQTIHTAHKKKQQKIAETLEALPSLENGGLEKILNS